MKYREHINNILKRVRNVDLFIVITFSALIGTGAIIYIWGNINNMVAPVASLCGISLMMFGMFSGMDQDEKCLDKIKAEFRRENGKLTGQYAAIGERIREQVKIINSMKSKKESKINTALLAAIFRVQYYRAEDIIEGYALPSIQQIIEVSNLLYIHSHSTKKSLSGTINYAMYLISGDNKYLDDDSFPTVRDVEAIFADYEKETNAEYYKLLSKYAQILQEQGQSDDE